MAITNIDAEQSLACGAHSLACLSYVDPTNVERSGIKLFCQACICPAAVLAANESLIADEDTTLSSYRVPCASGYAYGPKGLELYSRTCRSQLMCGFLCMGLPVVYTENLIQRQRIREKYKLQPPTSCSEIGAGCCYPCSMFQTHTFLYVRRHRPEASRQPSDRKGEIGPLKVALAKRAAAASAQSQEFAAGQMDSRQAAPTPPPQAQPPDAAGEYARAAALRESYVSPTKCVEAPRQPEIDAVKQPSLSSSMTATATTTPGNGACMVPAESSVGETPEQQQAPPVVTLFPPGRLHGRRPAQNGPTASASSAESRSTPASGSIPPPEVTDSPRMGAPAPATSYSGSSGSQPEQETSLHDSPSFQVPLPLPHPGMGRPPPTFVVPPALKPPDSADSEVMAAWMQGPKLSHLSQTLQRPADSGRNASGQTCAPSVHRPRPVPSSGVSCSDASLFSLDASALHVPPLPHPAVATAPPARQLHPAVNVSMAAPGLPPLSTTPGSSIHVGAYDTITSSKLSSMIDHAMLNGSGSSAPRGSGGTGVGNVAGSADVALQWDSYRQSCMETIAEGDGEAEPGLSNVLPVCSSAADVPLVGQEPPCGGASPLPKQASSAARNAGRGGRASGASASSRATLAGSGGRVSRAAGSDGFIPGALGGTGGAPLTALARMGSDCAGSGGPRSANGARKHSGPGSQRRTPLPVLSSGEAASVTSGASGRAGPASRDSGRQNVSAPGHAEVAVETSADNFSSLQGSGAVAVTEPPAFASPTAHPPFQSKPSDSTTAPPAVAYLRCSLGSDGDDEVNLASIRPSFMDGPEMQGLKDALRRADEGHQSTFPAAPCSPAPAVSTASAAVASQPQQRTMTLAPSANSLPRQGRYGGAAASPLPAASVHAAASAAHRAGGAGPMPYASYCADAGQSHEDEADSALEDDASSAIDGPVSSGEGGSYTTGVVCADTSRIPAGACRHSRPTASQGSATAAEQEAPPGDASVSVVAFATSQAGNREGAVASAAVVAAGCGVMAPASPGAGGGCVAEPAESSAFTLGRRSASGLSNGESNVEYDSVADSVSVSQQRQQKHWVNWMAQSVVSVGMSVTGSSRNLKGAGMGRQAPAGVGKASRAVPGAETAMSSLSVNQRLPHPVAEEPDEVSYGPWG